MRLGKDNKCLWTRNIVMSFLNCCLESKIYTRKLLAGGSEIVK